MLAKPLIKEIDRLLREGKLSQRKIAAQLGVSRGTVSSIASGRRGLHGREADEGEQFPYGPRSPAERCPRCGYRVYMPCLICCSRDFQRRRRGLICAAAHLKAKSAVSVELRKPKKTDARERRQESSTDSPARVSSLPDSYLVADFAVLRSHIPLLPIIPAAAAALA